MGRYGCRKTAVRDRAGFSVLRSMSTRKHSHTPRFIPPGGSLVEVTSRALQRRFLLRPGRVANEIIVGCLARARQAHPDVKLFAAVFLSNHFHLLLWVPDARTMAGFMGYLKTNLSKKLGRLHRWPGSLFRRRYDHVVVSDEEEAQIGRLRYVLAHGLKEDLVPRPQDWPGVHCCEALVTGAPLRGFWFDDTAAFNARARGERFHRYTHGHAVEVHFDKLPCWQHLTDPEYRSAVAALLRDLQTHHEVRRCTDGHHLPSARVCGRRLRQQDPHDRPATADSRRPRPRFHAFARTARRRLERALAHFLDAYRAAAERLGEGDRSAPFPPGCFPSPLPFVTAEPARAP